MYALIPSFLSEVKYMCSFCLLLQIGFRQHLHLHFVDSFSTESQEKCLAGQSSDIPACHTGEHWNNLSTDMYLWSGNAPKNAGHHNPRIQYCNDQAHFRCFPKIDYFLFLCQMSPCFQVLKLSFNKNISLPKQVNGCYTSLCVRFRRRMDIKWLRELLDNDFISFTVQCPAILWQIVRGADVFVPLILAIW